MYKTTTYTSVTKLTKLYNIIYLTKSYQAFLLLQPTAKVETSTTYATVDSTLHQSSQLFHKPTKDATFNNSLHDTFQILTHAANAATSTT